MDPEKLKALERFYEARKAYFRVPLGQDYAEKDADRHAHDEAIRIAGRNLAERLVDAAYWLLPDRPSDPGWQEPATFAAVLERIARQIILDSARP